MVIIITWRISIVLLSLLLSSCESSKPSESGLIVAVASNMQLAMEEIAESFAKQHEINVEVASGSSGVLSAQIRQGAPFDVFVSANMLYPNALQDEGLTHGSPKTYAYGTLIMWSVSGVELGSGMASLKSESIDNFAISNPETSPFGIAAKQALENTQLLIELQHKIITGESVAQVNQYVSSGAVQVGLTSRSVLYSSELNSQGNSIEVNRALYQPIEHAVVVLKKGFEQNLDAANLFHQFMFSSVAKAILIRYGYQTI